MGWVIIPHVFWLRFLLLHIYDIKSVTDFTNSRLQFPLSQRRKRRVLFTQAQVNAFCPLYPIPDTLHRISWYLAPDILYLIYLIYPIPDTWLLMSENQIPNALDICYLIWTQPTLAAQCIMCGGWVKSICLSCPVNWNPFPSKLCSLRVWRWNLRLALV